MYVCMYMYIATYVYFNVYTYGKQFEIRRLQISRIPYNRI